MTDLDDAFATVPRRELEDVPETWREKLAILRTIGGDDDLAQALVEELALRRINPAPREGKAECNDGIVLVSEWDTDYGRSLPVALRDQIAALAWVSERSDGRSRPYCWWSQPARSSCRRWLIASNARTWLTVALRCRDAAAARWPLWMGAC